MSWLFARPTPRVVHLPLPKCPPKLEIWAINISSTSQNWVKAVVWSKPTGKEIVGPFDDEAACEQFCDHANVEVTNRVKFYGEGKKP